MIQNKNFIEYEAKFYPVKKDKFREQLRKIGANLFTAERKMCRAIVDQIVYPQLKCTYIRVRDEGNCIRLSAKTTASENGDISDQKEIETIVSDFTNTKKIIESMGFKFTIYQENLRETWNFNGAMIEIDTWPGLETYTEIEADSEEHVRNTAELLGFKWDKKIITSAKEIYMKVYGITREQATEKLNYITFEKNPFTGLKRMPFI